MRRLFTIFVLLTLVWACQEAQDAEVFRNPDEIVNPNGESELALVMREMHFEANKIGREIEEGKNPDLARLKDLASQLTTAEPTDSNQIDESYHIFAENIEKRIADINSDEMVVKFNDFVNTCVGCHRQTCPGPIKKIQKLKIKA